MSIDEAWQAYAADCEQMRQLFLTDPMTEKYPALAASGHFILQQTQALAYNQVMAPRQDFPCFTTHHLFEPFIYTAHQPNPDFVYQVAFLNGQRRWRITGQRGTAHWIDAQVSRGWWGESTFGGVENYDFDADFHIESDGTFEIIASAEPVDGNWLRLDAADQNNAIQLRVAMYDWAREDPPVFAIEPMDSNPAATVIHDADEVARRLRLSGEFIKHAIGRWTTKGSKKLVAQAGMNQFLCFRGEAGRGGANPLAQYGQAAFELAPGEALIIEADIPDATYWGISLGTWWWETIDPVIHKSSINGSQAVADGDGKFRAVLSRRDPGVPNWLDPAGWDVGIILLRWYRATTEQRVTTKSVPFSDVRQHLPADTPVVTAEQRQREVDARHGSTLRWYGYR